MIKLQFPFNESEFHRFANPKDLITLDYGETLAGFYTERNPHRGIDYAIPYGGEVLSAHKGVVEYAGVNHDGYGLLIIIRDIDSQFGTFYAHLSDIFISKRDRVEAGQHIGNAGSTGNVTGPHLHFECREDWRRYTTHVNPNNYLPKISTTGIVDSPKTKLQKGEAIVACQKAFFRDETLYNRIGALDRGSKVELTGRNRKSGALTFYEVVLSRTVWMADKDIDGTVILQQTETVT